MAKPVNSLLVGSCLISFGAGMVLGMGMFDVLSHDRSDDMATEDHAHAPGTPDNHAHDEHEMTHDPIEWHDPDNPPSVSLNVYDDPKSGWNVRVQTENFDFTPENASAEHRPGEGHAHLYVDGVKLTRLYGEWYHMPDLEPGMHEVSVDLNANDHSPFVIDGENIQDAVMITQP